MFPPPGPPNKFVALLCNYIASFKERLFRVLMQSSWSPDMLCRFEPWKVQSCFVVGWKSMQGWYIKTLELKEKTKLMVEYPHPRIRKFSNICLVCFSSVHLFCRNTQMRLLVQPHESCHKNISKRGIFSAGQKKMGGGGGGGGGGGSLFQVFLSLGKSYNMSSQL